MNVKIENQQTSKIQAMSISYERFGISVMRACFSQEAPRANHHGFDDLCWGEMNYVEKSFWIETGRGREAAKRHSKRIKVLSSGQLYSEVEIHRLWLARHRFLHPQMPLRKMIKIALSLGSRNNPDRVFRNMAAGISSDKRRYR